MKRILLLPAFLCISLISISQGLEAFVDFGVFNNPSGKPYVETYLSITGRSIKWKNESERLKSNIEVTLVLWKDTTIVNFSKENINEFTKNDSTSKAITLIYEQRLAADKGKYRLQIKLDDLNDTLKPYYTGSLIEIGYPSDSTAISSIMAIKSFSKTKTPSKISKSGFDLVPNVFNFYPTEVDKFTFYTEIYPKANLALGESFLVIYYLKNHENNKVLGKYKRFKRMTASPVNVLINSFDISGLYSGNFDFIVEVRNRKNRLLATKTYFLQRENTTVKMNLEDISSVNVASTFAERFTNFDTLSLIINAMAPITSAMEKQFANNLIAKGDIHPMQQYLLNFWEQRDIDNPEAPFKAYMQEVSKVEKLFGTRINHGFETDRGRVYLEYGEPNTIVKNYNEPSAYPYEIWHYYNLRNQRNRKFIFYNTDLSSNEFTLLHSDAIGEPNDYQWRIHLRARDSGFKSIDQTGEGENDWGSKYNEWYQEPR